MRILVTDADNRAALAVARSLGRAGHHVAVAHHRHPSLASSSRYCQQRLVTPNPLRDPAGFLDAVVALSDRYGFDAAMPVSDITTLTLAKAAHDGRLGVRLCLPEYPQLALAADKYKTLELARRLDVPVPRTFVLMSPGSPPGELDLEFPVVLKPARSRVWSDNRWHFNAVSYAESRDHLEELLRQAAPQQYPILLQERIEGPGVGVFAAYNRGRLLALFSHRRIREKPPSGGVSVLREAIPVDPAAGQHACALLEALHWHGVAMVEFKRDARDGQLKLMEINGRLWGSLQLAIDAGVDFPAMMASLLAGEPVTPIEGYHVGVQSRWLWGDIDAMLALLIKPRASLNLPGDHPGKWRTLLSFLLPWRPGMRYEVLSLRDPGPWLYETRRWFRPRDGG